MSFDETIAAMDAFAFVALGKEKKAIYRDIAGRSIECTVIFADTPREYLPGFEGNIAENIFTVAIYKNDVARPAKEARICVDGEWYKLEKRIEDSANLTHWMVRNVG